MLSCQYNGYYKIIGSVSEYNYINDRQEELYAYLSFIGHRLFPKEITLSEIYNDFFTSKPMTTLAYTMNEEETGEMIGKFNITKMLIGGILYIITRIFANIYYLIIC